MLGLAIFLVCLLAKVNSQFILDSQYPVVISENNYGTPNSKAFSNTLFGYSMAFLSGEYGENSVPKSAPVIGTLFIGAPNDNTKGTINSGIVWSCKFRTNGQTNCSILSGISNQPSPPSCRRNQSLSFLETETNQWIGASLTTVNQSLYACAPRWKQNDFKFGRNGQCRYENSRTALAGACYKTTPSNINESTILGPYYERNKDRTFGNWSLNSQFGFSSHATHSKNLVVGVPSPTTDVFGVYNSRGTYMEYLTANSGKRLLKNEDSEWHSYLGYSVTSGRNMGGVEYVAVAAPRAQYYSGAVLINEFAGSTPNLRVVGEQFGAYFGYSLATADLNGDGDDEMLVGAPHFTLDFDSKESFNGGCVFIYDVDLRTQTVSQISRICLQRQQNGARFGSAIENVGDINFDQREDFAVAAPYYDDGVGAVFIYYGGLPLAISPAQVILGRTFKIPNFRGFGTSILSGDLDIDGNSTPDLAISSFETNHVVILRSRPIAIPSLKITYHSAHSVGDEGKINSFLPTESNKVFRLRVCNTFTFSVELQPENEFKLECYLQLELDRRLTLVYYPKRTEFRFRINLSSTLETCVFFLMEVNMGRLGNNSDDAIRNRAGLSYNETNPNGSDTIQPALLNLSEGYESGSKFQDNFLSFNPFLPAPIEDAFSEWEALEISQDNCDSDGNSTCNPNLVFEIPEFYFKSRDGQPTRYLGGNHTFLVGQVETLIVVVSLGNQGETAYRPILGVSLKLVDNTFDMPQTEWQWQLTEPSRRVEIFQDNPSLNINGNDTFIIGSFNRPSRPLHNETVNIYHLEISHLENIKVMNSLNGTLQLKIEAFPQGQQETELISRTYSIPMKAQVNIELEALTPESEQSEINPSNNRVDLSQIFLLRNTGVSSVKEVRAEIYVPTHSRVNETYTQILGVVSPAQYNSILRCEAHGFSFYQVDFRSAESDQNLRPESLFLESKSGTNKSTPISSAATDEIITLSSCGANPLSSFCRKITCEMELPSMETRAIRLDMYLLPATSAQVISRKLNPTGIRVQTIISVVYLKTMEIGMEAFTMRMFIMPQEIPAWIILVAGAGGLSIFLLITVALHKCGFFRRKSKEELNQLKRQTQTWLEVNNLDETFPLNEGGVETSLYSE